MIGILMRAIRVVPKKEGKAPNHCYKKIHSKSTSIKSAHNLFQLAHQQQVQHVSKYRFFISWEHTAKDVPGTAK
jgi:hypothetical protein